jgi:hypothetical protein
MSDEMNWMIMSHNGGDEVVQQQAGHTYDLFNCTEKEALVYGSREYGINLVWGDAGRSDNVRFQRQSGNGGLKFGEPIAINIKGGGFLHYERREYGINLVWKDSPFFEWRIMGGTEGADVHAGRVVALFNTVESDYLFYDPRTYGINLKWLRDKGKHNEGTFWEKVGKAAAPVVGGLVGGALGGPAGSAAGAAAGKAAGNAI